MTKKKYEAPQVSREELEEQLAVANASLWEANEKLKEEERKRMEFFSNMSHDLRAPMQALSGSLEYLESADVTEEERRDIIRLMSRRLNGLKQMVEDLFLLSKVENPDLRLNLETINMAMFLEEYFFSAAADSAFDGRDLRLEIQPSAEIEARFDPNLMLRVMDNLFTNARKYSKEGCEIVLAAEKTAADEICITVSDTGSGIREEDLPHIFERTYRGDKARSPEDGSSGFGLAITKSIIERHNGRIFCESTVGKGSRFTLFLPVK